MLMKTTLHWSIRATTTPEEMSSLQTSEKEHSNEHNTLPEPDLEPPDLCERQHEDRNIGEDVWNGVAQVKAEEADAGSLNLWVPHLLQRHALQGRNDRVDQSPRDIYAAKYLCCHAYGSGRKQSLVHEQYRQLDDGQVEQVDVLIRQYNLQIVQQFTNTRTTEGLTLKRRTISSVLISVMFLPRPASITATGSATGDRRSHGPYS